MKILRRFVFLSVLLLPILSFAQDLKSDDAAKEKQRKLAAVVEQALADTQNLRLPENRALFYAQIGNLMWPTDQEHATGLFQNAAVEMVNAQNYAESKRTSNPNNELLTGGQTRQQILNIIATRNAELALDLLIKTRPATIQRAFASENKENTKIGNYSGGNNYIAQNERSMEQNFYRMAADQNPERAIKLLKESLAKGLSNDTYYQLVRLAQKDQAAATEIASQLIDKLLHAGFMTDGQPLYINIQVTNQVLSHVMTKQGESESKLKFDDAQARDLANKFISAYLSGQQIAPYIGGNIIPIAEKFSPSSVDQIKKRNTLDGRDVRPSELDAAYQKLLAADTSAEQMLAMANKFPLDQRRQIYQSASNKFMGKGNTEAARNVLAEHFADETRDQMLSNFDNQTAYNLSGEGKFVEAERIIDNLPMDQRVAALVNLATAAYGRDQTANKTYAMNLLSKAGQLTNERPENSTEMGWLMQVIGGYSNFEPVEATRLFEGLVPKINELTDAAAVINGFQSNSNVRDGEFIMTQGDPFNSYGANSNMIGTLGRNDFDRTMKLIDSFSRSEMRISL